MRLWVCVLQPLACAFPELGHPGIQLLLVPHLKDDVCPVLHLQDKGIEVVRHLEACAPSNLLDTGAGCL